MRYLDQDIGFFVARSPYLALSKPRAAAQYLGRQLELGAECAHVLGDYPGLLIEPLEFFYTCLRNLGALDPCFFAALLRDHSWRGVVWGSFLALLEPRGEFIDPLRAAAPGVPHNRWLVECAIAQLEGRSPDPAHANIAALAEGCRSLLAGVPRPTVPLRRAPTAAELEQMTVERERVRRCYLRGGADAAREALRGTLAEYYAQDYPRWLRAGAGAPPALCR